MVDEYTLTFEEAIRAMLDGKYVAAEGVTSVFRFSTEFGFQYRTYDVRGRLIWENTLAFIGVDFPKRKWIIVDTLVYDPCPFCGNSCFSLSTHKESDGMKAQIICRECDSEFTLRGKDLDEICNKWNGGIK